MHTPSPASLAKERIREMAAELGFVACGFTSADPVAAHELLDTWLKAGRHGDMTYLEGDSGRRLAPRTSLPEARSVIVVAWPYPPSPPIDPHWQDTLSGRIAAYALGADYHAHMKSKLDALAGLVNVHLQEASTVQVDSGPLLEKELAKRAGIGWYGRNTNIISTYHSSYLLLGCLLTSMRFEPDPPSPSSHCGTCRQCLPACPTGALDSGPTIDARVCISYLTIEYRGPIDASLRPKLGNWVFGCDVCQQVCPWNESTVAASPELTPYLPDLLGMSEDGYRTTYKHTAVSRAKRRGLARNAAVALGNSLNPRAIEPLADALCGHDEALVRAHCAWALGRIGGDQARRYLRACAKQSQVPPVRKEIDNAISSVA